MWVSKFKTFLPNIFSDLVSFALPCNRPPLKNFGSTPAAAYGLNHHNKTYVLWQKEASAFLCFGENEKNVKYVDLIYRSASSY